MTTDTLCFGELLLRFSTPGHERFGQSGRLEVNFGGAEANVGVSLARFGHSVEMVSTVADDNPMAEALLAGLRMHGMGTSYVSRREGRMGAYFLETGAVRRPSRILYDRAHSAFAYSDPSEFDWDSLLNDVRIVHVSGITPATGPGPAQACQDLAAKCAERGIELSFDGNYREALWKSWDGDGPAILRNILSNATIAFINERDIALLLGTEREEREVAIKRAFEAFPRLKMVAATHRAQTSVSNQSIAGDLFTRSETYVSRAHELEGVVDRIGGGDAFAAGVLHCLLNERDPQYTIEFAMAAGAIKHSIPGDFNLTSVQEVEDAMNESGLDVRR
ncbi:sugar kinase [Ponticaulis sp.]|uniref:sugar kinase n=1 Tax=Ponticaulis sp. TaxID=2020902 RepID=UPI000B7573FB|nr:sugar kinase [Ponticaulis sp.]MAI91523.1 2-keto-3-deoxygluconate kinase [Ponticaulis sp.]OUX97484.1 MAG: 2-keto-3-deoxygluconate kinase [Hyphomonadaceae bacterium TMED5]|tara:strand:- start:37713 stop:38714 length:1002 start_codon:yes stop_codon:yes gene_type:complete